jgi:hypothetical protein
MTYNEALIQLDEPIEGEDYGNKMMVSKSIGEHILKSKYGLVYCTHDWPAPFYPKPKDLEATDYKIVTSVTEN